jgi:hypothetical protein
MLHLLFTVKRRVLNLCDKYCGGHIPDTTHDPAFALPFDLDTVVRHVFLAAEESFESIYSSILHNHSIV